MAALFIKYGNNGMLKHSVGSSTAPASISCFTELINNPRRYSCIITDIGISTNDIIQFFPTFDDFIHHYYFGKGVGNMSVRGILFANCTDNAFLGLDILLSALGKSRGEIVTCIMNGHFFKGVLLDCSLAMVSEPETHIQFTVNFAVIDHGMPSPPPKKPSC